MSLSSSFVILSKSVFVLLSLYAAISSQAEAATSIPLVLYNFSAGNGSEVYDVSGNGTPLNLKIRDTGNIRWLQGGGLAVDRPTLIQTTGPARKITDAVKASNALTIEAWIQPASKTQTGPACIITMSADTLGRNLTLGQNRATYGMRLRTSKSDDNGAPSLQSKKGTLGTGLTHVVYTRNSNGLARLYIDGILESKKRVRGNLDNWNNRYRFSLANELTGNRPWRGNFYQVAIYSHVLGETEIKQNFTSGSGNRTISSQGSESRSATPSGSTAKSSGTTSESGSVSIGWTAPVMRSNGDALAMNEISGYTVYYGNTAGTYSDSISINDAYTTSATIAELPPGTYYFVVTARDTAGWESEYSNMATKPVL